MLQNCSRKPCCVRYSSASQIVMYVVHSHQLTLTNVDETSIDCTVGRRCICAHVCGLRPWLTSGEQKQFTAFSFLVQSKYRGGPANKGHLYTCARLVFARPPVLGTTTASTAEYPSQQCQEGKACQPPPTHIARQPLSSAGRAARRPGSPACARSTPPTAAARR